MKKKQLSTFLQKYNLGGQVESIIMNLQESQITTQFSLSDTSLCGKVTFKNAEYNIINDIENTKLGVYNTSQLLKFVDVLDENIDFSIHSTNDKFEYISMIDDKNTDIKYILSELTVIPKAVVLKEEKLPEFELDIELTLDLIETINKSRTALRDTRTFYFDIIKDRCFLILNDGKNKIKIEVEPTEESKLSTFSESSRVLFPIDLFRTVLNVSKDFETSRLQVSSNHLLKLMFDNDEFESEYFIMADS